MMRVSIEGPKWSFEIHTAAELPPTLTSSTQPLPYSDLPKTVISPSRKTVRTLKRFKIGVFGFSISRTSSSTQNTPHVVQNALAPIAPHAQIYEMPGYQTDIPELDGTVVVSEMDNPCTMRSSILSSYCTPSVQIVDEDRTQDDFPSTTLPRISDAFPAEFSSMPLFGLPPLETDPTWQRTVQPHFPTDATLLSCPFSLIDTSDCSPLWFGSMKTMEVCHCGYRYQDTSDRLRHLTPISPSDLEGILSTDTNSASASNISTKPLVCEYCGPKRIGKYQKGNSAKHAGAAHRHLHRSAIKYKCGTCVTEFCRADARRKHVWKKHGNTDGKPLNKKNKVTYTNSQHASSSQSVGKNLHCSPTQLAPGNSLYPHSDADPHRFPRFDDLDNVCTITPDYLRAMEQEMQSSKELAIRYPHVDNGPTQDQIRRSVSLSCKAKALKRGVKLVSDQFQRSISTPYASTVPILAEDPGINTVLHHNQVAHFYASKGGPIVWDPDGGDACQRTNSWNLRHGFAVVVRNTSCYTASDDAQLPTRTLTVTIKYPLVAKAPFPGLIRSGSLETPSFVESVGHLQQTRNALRSNDRKFHYFRGGKVSVSSRGPVMGAAYPPMKCQHCDKVFTGQKRRRDLAGHRRRVHGYGSRTKARKGGSRRSKRCEGRNSVKECKRLSFMQSATQAG